MYMHDCTNKEAIRKIVVEYLETQNLPCDKKLKRGKVRGFGSAKKDPVYASKLETNLMVPIPKIFYDLCEVILKYVDREGIFRKAGSRSKQDDMKRRIAKGEPWKSEDVNVIDVAALLKHYIKELPVHLIPTDYHTLFLACCDLDNKEELLVLSTLLLPAEHLNLLSYLMVFFHQVASFSQYNKMDFYNMAVCVAPNILPVRECCTETSVKVKEIVKILIENADDIGVIPIHIQRHLNLDEKGSTNKLKVYFANLFSIFC